MQDEADDEDLAHWREQLRGVRPVELPPATGTDNTRSLRFELDADLLDAVDSLARDAHTTRFVVLLGAFQTVLARWCGTEDVAVGTTVSQRDTAELEQLIAPLFTTVVLRADLSGDPSFSALLDRTTTRVFDSMDHCRTPFELVLEQTRAGAASDARNPLFNVLFELDHEQEQPALTEADRDAAFLDAVLSPVTTPHTTWVLGATGGYRELDQTETPARPQSFQSVWESCDGQTPMRELCPREPMCGASGPCSRHPSSPTWCRHDDAVAAPAAHETMITCTI